MYDPVALDLSYAKQSLPRHYDSDEEDISESEGHASPLDAHKRSATLDSIMSVSDGGHEHEQPAEPGAADRPAFPRLLSLPANTKTSRPGSIDTVKRSSSATFVTEPCTIFDHDDDDDEMIIELPSPSSTTPLQSPLLLQPSVYVPSEPLTSQRNSFNSSSSASVYSDDDSDVFVAEQVTYVEHAKPSLILISSTESSPTSYFPPRDAGLPSPQASASSGSVYSNDEATKALPLLGETCMPRGRGRSLYPTRALHTKAPGSLSALDTLKNCGPRHIGNEPMSAPPVEAPRPLSFRARSMSFSRPQTPVSEARRRLHKEPPRRPPSAQSTATFSLFPTQSQTPNPIPAHGSGYEHSCASSTYSLPLSSSQPPSRTASPGPYSSGSPAYNRSRSGSLYSVCSTSAAHTQAFGKRPPLPYRGSGSIPMVKSRSSTMPMGGYSSSSLRAELNPQPEDQKASSKSKGSRETRSGSGSKKSLKQPKDKESEASSSAKSLVGFMLRGKRKSVIKNWS